MSRAALGAAFFVLSVVFFGTLPLDSFALEGGANLQCTEGDYTCPWKGGKPEIRNNKTVICMQGKPCKDVTAKDLAVEGSCVEFNLCKGQKCDGADCKTPNLPVDSSGSTPGGPGDPAGSSIPEPIPPVPPQPGSVTTGDFLGTQPEPGVTNPESGDTQKDQSLIQRLWGYVSGDDVPQSFPSDSMSGGIPGYTPSDVGGLTPPPGTSFGELNPAAIPDGLPQAQNTFGAPFTGGEPPEASGFFSNVKDTLSAGYESLTEATSNAFDRLVEWGTGDAENLSGQDDLKISVQGMEEYNKVYNEAIAGCAKGDSGCMYAAIDKATQAEKAFVEKFREPTGSQIADRIRERLNLPSRASEPTPPLNTPGDSPSDWTCMGGSTCLAEQSGQNQQFAQVPSAVLDTGGVLSDVQPGEPPASRLGDFATPAIAPETDAAPFVVPATDAVVDFAKAEQGLASPFEYYGIQVSDPAQGPGPIPATAMADSGPFDFYPSASTPIPSDFTALPDSTGDPIFDAKLDARTAAYNAYTQAQSGLDNRGVMASIGDATGFSESPELQAVKASEAALIAAERDLSEYRSSGVYADVDAKIADAQRTLADARETSAQNQAFLREVEENRVAQFGAPGLNQETAPTMLADTDLQPPQPAQPTPASADTSNGGIEPGIAAPLMPVEVTPLSDPQTQSVTLDARGKTSTQLADEARALMGLGSNDKVIGVVYGDKAFFKPAGEYLAGGYELKPITSDAVIGVEKGYWATLNAVSSNPLAFEDAFREAQSNISTQDDAGKILSVKNPFDQSTFGNEAADFIKQQEASKSWVDNAYENTKAAALGIKPAVNTYIPLETESSINIAKAIPVDVDTLPPPPPPEPLPTPIPAPTPTPPADSKPATNPLPVSPPSTPDAPGSSVESPAKPPAATPAPKPTEIAQPAQGGSKGQGETPTIPGSGTGQTPTPGLIPSLLDLLAQFNPFSGAVANAPLKQGVQNPLQPTAPIPPQPTKQTREKPISTTPIPLAGGNTKEAGGVLPAFNGEAGGSPAPLREAAEKALDTIKRLAGITPGTMPVPQPSSLPLPAIPETVPQTQSNPATIPTKPIPPKIAAAPVEPATQVPPVQTPPPASKPALPPPVPPTSGAAPAPVPTPIPQQNTPITGGVVPPQAGTPTSPTPPQNTRTLPGKIVETVAATTKAAGRKAKETIKKVASDIENVRLSPAERRYLENSKRDLGRKQKGIASTYNLPEVDKLNPRKRTASGSDLDLTSYTAAILGGGTPYAWGTKVVVKHKNGKEIVVVIDSTGNQKDRHLDLSPAAAKALGISDIAEVEFAVVSVPTPGTARYSKGRTDVLQGGGKVPEGTLDTKLAELSGASRNPLVQLAEGVESIVKEGVKLVDRTLAAVIGGTSPLTRGENLPPRGMPIRGAQVKVSNIVQDACAVVGGGCRVTSGARSKSENTKAGGAKKSRHLQGDAVDVKVPVEKGLAFAQALKTALCQRNDCNGGIGYYGDNDKTREAVFHVDTRGEKVNWGPDFSGASMPKNDIGRIVQAPRTIDKEIGPKLAALDALSPPRAPENAKPKTPTTKFADKARKAITPKSTIPINEQFPAQDFGNEKPLPQIAGTPDTAQPPKPAKATPASAPLPKSQPGLPLTGKGAQKLRGVLGGSTPVNGTTPNKAAAKSPSYYPHWASRTGDITPAILDKLAPGTTIGVHHDPKSTSDETIRRILNHPNGYTIAWYAESNVREKNDSATGRSVSSRIREARKRQTELEKTFGGDRFTNEIELDAAREKSPRNRLADARNTQKNGFSYFAKSLTPEQVKALREKGIEVTRVVFEDVVKEDQYRDNARRLAENGDRVTLIIHQGAYDGDPGSTDAEVRDTMAATKDPRNNKTTVTAFDALPNVEAYRGLPSGFAPLKTAAAPQIPTKVADASPSSAPPPPAVPPAAPPVLPPAPQPTPPTPRAPAPPAEKYDVVPPVQKPATPLSPAMPAEGYDAVTQPLPPQPATTPQEVQPVPQPTPSITDAVKKAGERLSSYEPVRKRIESARANIAKTREALSVARNLWSEPADGSPEKNTINAGIAASKKLPEILTGIGTGLPGGANGIEKLAERISSYANEFKNVSARNIQKVIADGDALVKEADAAIKRATSKMTAEMSVAKKELDAAQKRAATSPLSGSESKTPTPTQKDEAQPPPVVQPTPASAPIQEVPKEPTKEPLFTPAYRGVIAPTDPEKQITVTSGYRGVVPPQKIETKTGESLPLGVPEGIPDGKQTYVPPPTITEALKNMWKSISELFTPSAGDSGKGTGIAQGTGAGGGTGSNIGAGLSQEGTGAMTYEKALDTIKEYASDARQRGILAERILHDFYETPLSEALPPRSPDDSAWAHYYRDMLELSKADSLGLEIETLRLYQERIESDPSFGDENTTQVVASLDADISRKTSEYRTLVEVQTKAMQEYIERFAQAQDYTRAQLMETSTRIDTELARQYGPDWRELANSTSISPSSRQVIANALLTQELARRVASGEYVLPGERDGAQPPQSAQPVVAAAPDSKPWYSRFSDWVSKGLGNGAEPTETAVQNTPPITVPASGLALPPGLPRFETNTPTPPAAPKVPTETSVPPPVVPKTTTQPAPLAPTQPTPTSPSSGFSLPPGFISALGSLGQMLSGLFTNTSPPPAPTPIVSNVVAARLVANPSIVEAGATTRLSWTSTHSYGCVVFGPGGEIVRGSASGTAMPTVNKSSQFALVCAGARNSFASATTSVMILGENGMPERAFIPTSTVYPTEFSIGSSGSADVRAGGTSGSGVTSGSGTSAGGDGSGVGTQTGGTNYNGEPPGSSVTPTTSGHDSAGNAVSAWCDPEVPIDTFIRCLQALPK